MGLLVHTSFETREGIPVSSVYARILSLSCDFRGYFTALTVVLDTHLSREKRLQGAASLFVPTLQYRISVEVPYNSNWGNSEFLYSKVKETIVASGLTVEDVLESPPEPPAPTETSPTEPVPEPAPTESTPEPAPTEPTPEPAPEPTPEPEVSQQSSESTQ